MRPCPHPVSALLPHRSPMLLLDEIVSYDDTTLIAKIVISEASLFLESGGVPSHVGLEYMAQACGALVGAMALDAGLPVRIGFLLGTRRYRVYAPKFRLRERLLVTVQSLYRDERSGAFDCRIEIGGERAAEAQLVVYQPDLSPTVSAGAEALSP